MKKQAMNRICRSLLRLVILCVVLLLSVAPAWSVMTIQDVQTTDVTSSGFAVIWKTCDSEVPHVGVAARPRIAVFSDAGGTDDISSQLEVTSVPLFGGDPDAFDDYGRQEDMDALRELAQNLGLMKIGVQGCLPQTTYFFKIYSENDGLEAFWPGSGVASITTTAENAFVADSKQVLLSLTNDSGSLDARGWLATASSSDAIYPVSTYVEDGAGTNQAYLNLCNLFDVDEDNWTPTGLRVVTLEIRMPESAPIYRGLTFMFSEVFHVSEVRAFNINIDGAGDNTAPSVQASPPGGPFNVTQFVALSADEPAYIFYTTDGSLPTTGSSLYIDPIQIDVTTTVRFFAVDMAGNFSVEEIAAFVYDNPPYEPSLPDPENGATRIHIDVTLGWQGGDPDPGDVVTYDVYLGTAPDSLSPIAVCQDQTQTWCHPAEPDGLSYGTPYFWQVVAKDDKGSETAGPIWQFTTFPHDGDEDLDGLTNQDEMSRGTDPFDWDTDKDGYSDGEEVDAGTNPLDKTERPSFSPSYGDLDEDGDLDGEDLALLEAAFGSIKGDAEFNAMADFNKDDSVDDIDLDMFSRVFGYPFQP